MAMAHKQGLFYDRILDKLLWLLTPFEEAGREDLAALSAAMVSGGILSTVCAVSRQDRRTEDGEQGMTDKDDSTTRTTYNSLHHEAGPTVDDEYHFCGCAGHWECCRFMRELSRTAAFEEGSQEWTNWHQMNQVRAGLTSREFSDDPVTEDSLMSMQPSWLVSRAVSDSVMVNVGAMAIT